MNSMVFDLSNETSLGEVLSGNGGLPKSTGELACKNLKDRSILEQRRAVHLAMDRFVPHEEKQAFLEALEKAPLVVEVESDPAAFLRISNYCVEAAAQRLANHWNYRKRLLEDRAFRSLLDLSENGALADAERNLLKAGFFLTLLKDAKGRPIVFVDEEKLPISLAEYKPMRPRLAFFVQVKCAAENHLSQTDGMRTIRMLRSTAFDPSMYRTHQDILNTSMHQKLFDCFFIGIPPPGARKHFRRVLLPLAQSVPINSGYSKVIMGENRDKLRSALLAEGFRLDNLPPVLGGTWSYDAVDEWFASCQQQQQQRSTIAAGEHQECSAPSTPKKRTQRRREASGDIPMEAKLVHVVPLKDRRTVNHTYHNYSQVPPQPDYTGEPSDITRMSFVQKVHYILSLQSPKLKKCIGWLPHGRAFKLGDPVDLDQSNVLSLYFGMERTAIFVLQLRSHGFKVLTTGKDRGAYYHECMLRGLPHLTKYIPAPRDVRNLKPDPENEPCLESISSNYPLPC